MSLWSNFKAALNVSCLAATDTIVTKTFGNFDNAAAAQADVNTLSAIMDSEITVRHFSKRKLEKPLYLEDLLGEAKPDENLFSIEKVLDKTLKRPIKEEDKKQALIEWYNSLSEEEKKTLKELNQ